ncbi:hypothetical protein [Marmoricola sp. RAF53]|uniref:hypothetical protein n=1 Tax=Marmoricola sp. RAF53 TaxID=3233059 RepID=UPI003F967583
MLETDDDATEDRTEQIRSVLLKALALVIGVGFAVGIGTWIVVSSLGLNDTELANTGPGLVQPITPLPTTALPGPTDTPSFDPSPQGLVTGGPTAGATGDLLLNAAPLFVKPGERINLTGQWAGRDAMGLLVQRLEDGQWANFGVQTTVRVGTFETYVITSRTGDQVFRVYDPETNTASNEVKVTVG